MPGVSSPRNWKPQSKTTISFPISNAVMFLPTSSTPPRGITRTTFAAGGGMTSVLFSFDGRRDIFGLGPLLPPRPILSCLRPPPPPPPLVLCVLSGRRGPPPPPCRPPRRIGGRPPCGSCVFTSLLAEEPSVLTAAVKIGLLFGRRAGAAVLMSGIFSFMTDFLNERMRVLENRHPAPISLETCYKIYLDDKNPCSVQIG